MGKLTPEQIEEALQRGATVDAQAKLISVPGLKALAEQLSAIIESNQASNASLIKAVDRMTEVIAKKDFKGTDVSALVDAVAGLKQQTAVIHKSVEWSMSGERDRRGLIDLNTIRFIPTSKVLN